MVVLVNRSACGGTALEKWKRVEPMLLQRFGSFAVAAVKSPAEATRLVGVMLGEGERDFVAAGGDGTVNLLVQSIVEQAEPSALATVRVGAIGLGSSNDFHKPFRPERMFDGVPCKVDFESAMPYDVGVLAFEDAQGVAHTRYWILNASIGITAEANLFFNTAGPAIRSLKRFSPMRGIVYAALHAIATYRVRGMAIRSGEGEAIETGVTNLGVVKNPHFTGSLSYDSPHEPDSGYFHVHLCKRTSIVGTLITLIRLLWGKFSGVHWTRSWRAKSLHVTANRLFAVEYDGEVVRTRCVSFSIRHKLLRVCT